MYSDTQRPKDNDDYSVEGVGISDRYYAELILLYYY